MSKKRKEYDDLKENFDFLMNELENDTRNNKKSWKKKSIKKQAIN